MNSRRRTSRAGSANLRRRGPVRSVRERIVIVCEGSKTEPVYLRYVHSAAASLIVELVIVDEPATSPKQLVERAVSIKRDSDRELRRTRDPNAVAEHIWCVFDVDEHLFIREACAHAAAHGINLAVSNPCVELWFLLHFQSQTSYIDRAEVFVQLKRHLSSYEKSAVRITDLPDGHDEAKKRAIDLDRKHAGDGTDFPENNPSTGMWKLVDLIKSDPHSSGR